MAHLNDIKDQLALVSANKSILDMLIEFEKTLDNCNLYAYKNWKNGELVSGPEIERYWFTCKFMYPYTMMPDPMGALRLEKYGCKVTYEKDIFEAPIHISDSSSYRDPHRKSAKLKKHNVWIISIQMPKQFIDERMIDEIELENENSVALQTDDISAAYDDDIESVDDPSTDMPDEGEEL